MKYDCLKEPRYLVSVLSYSQAFFMIYIFFTESKILDSGDLCIGIYESTSVTRGIGTMFYKVYDTSFVGFHFVHVDGKTNYKENTKHILYETNGVGELINDNPTEADIEKYKYPVKTINKKYNLGNDSYEYAKYERDIAYKYYGFNIVQIGIPIDRSKISVTKLDGSKFTMLKTNNLTDTFLVYSNINPKFYDGWHICPDSLCTSENFDKVMDGGYGYLFRDKIYSKEETEKYWNLIEQYKLRLNTNEN